MKQPLPILLASLLLLCWSCGQSPAPGTVLSAMASPVSNSSQKKLADSTALLQPLVELTPAEVNALLTENHVEQVFLNSPDNGFFGENHYRIEFIITEMKPLPDNPLVYQVKGKNRYKKKISTFEGLMEIKRVAEYKDDDSGVTDSSPIEFRDAILNFGKGYTMQGIFCFNEDSTKHNSGQLTGTFNAEFCTALDKNDPDVGGDPQVWICYSNSPSKGSGYLFSGNWTSFKNPSVQKPVIWAQNIYHFANDILADFSYGDRNVTINPKYRSLGWDTYWSGEEWWADSPKSAK